MPEAAALRGLQSHWTVAVRPRSRAPGTRMPGASLPTFPGSVKVIAHAMTELVGYGRRLGISP